MYNTVYIDGELILRRNWSVLVATNRLSVPGLIKSFFQSVVKIARENPTDHVTLLFDKSPYHKREFVDDYKGDRVYVTEEDLTPDKSPEELERIQREIDNFKVRSEVKYFIIFNFNKIGIPSIIKGGWEADDWARLCSLSERTKDSDKKSLLVSKDSDWIMNVAPNMDYRMISKRGDVFHNYEDLSKSCQGDPYEHYSIWYALNGSHNFLKKNLQEGCTYSMGEIKEMIKSDNYSFTSDPELFKRQLKSFDITLYPDYSKCEWMAQNIPEKKSFLTKTEFNDFCSQNFLNITSNYYENFINGLKKD